MASSTPSQSDAARKALGVYLSPGLGVTWEGKLKPLMDKLFISRVGDIPWLPPGWLANVRDLQSRFPDDLVRIAPAKGSIHPNPESPDWILSDPAKIDAWTAIAKTSDNVIAAFAKGKQEEGRAELEDAIANAEFWDRAYRIAVGIRDAVPNAAGAIASNLWNGLGLKWKLILGVAAIGAAVYFLPKLSNVARLAKKVAKA